MTAYAGPAPTLTTKSGWARVALSSGRAFLVNKTPTGACTCIPEEPSLARGAAGQPHVALTLLLARMPAITEASIVPLVIGGSLALTCSFSITADELAALEAQLGMKCSPLFIRSGTTKLRDVATVYAQSSLLGFATQVWLGTFLPAQQALDVLRSFEGSQSELYVDTRIEGDPVPEIQPVAVDALLGGVLDDLDRRRYISMIVPQADGTTTPVPDVTGEIPQVGSGTRDMPAPLAMAATGQRLVAIPFAMTPSSAARPSAVALAAGGATGPVTRLTSNSQTWLGNDAIILVNGGTDPPDGAQNTPTEHLPLFTAPDAAFWTDAVDPAAAWYPPSFVPVVPAASDDPSTAAFTFEFSRSGGTLGSGGVQTGLTATVRITVDEQMRAATGQALASAGSKTPHPVPLNNLSVSLEIPYRQAGSATVITQRFPGTLTQNATRITVSVPLLDDWVRLAYNALAYPPASGFPAPRLIIDYAFTVYQWILAGGLQVVYGGKLAQLASVASREELPQNLTQPTLIQRDLIVVGPRSYVQYRQEGTLTRALPAGVIAAPLRLPNTSIVIDRPPLLTPPAGIIHLPPRRLITRSIVREEAVDLQFPCASLGALYLQVAADGVTKTSIGCQDALKLGETAAKAFEEIVPLRTPAYRAYRSLQQPGRFLVVPAAYRIGRYASSEGDKAFRPIILLYGVLDADPTKNRYVLAATLIADVSPYQLTLLRDALRAYTPAGSTPTIVFPTDPYIGASITYAWTVPGGLDQPQALNVLDTFNVTLSMAMDQAALLTAMINNSGIQGKVTFALPDGTNFDAALVIDGNVIGPPDTGPVTATLTGSTIVLANGTQQAMNVLDIATVNASGSVTVTQVNVALAPGATSSQPAPPAVVRAVASATAADHPTLDELDIFIEDVTMTVNFIDQVNFSNHGLTALAVQARLGDSGSIQEASLPQDATATMNFTLPITTYLAGHTLQYALKETSAAGTIATAWRDWDLSNGAVIGITADLL
jgi:hypothetical protein